MSGYLFSSLPLWPLLLYSLKILSDILKVDAVFVSIIVVFLLMVLYLGDNLLAISTLLTYYHFPLSFISVKSDDGMIRR